MTVVVIGVSGLGAETCKNLLLLGVGKVHIIDDQIINHDDLGNNFLFCEEDLGKERADIAVRRLQELNPASRVSSSACPLDSPDKWEIDLSAISALIVTKPIAMTDLFAWNERCRKANVTFIYALTGGICAHVFADFGENHLVYNENGSEPIEKNILKIVKVDDQHIRVDFENPAGRPDRVIMASTHYRIDGFHDVLPNTKDRTLKVIRQMGDDLQSIRFQYEWDAPESYGILVQQAGYLREIKMPQTFSCSSLQSLLSSVPSFNGRHGNGASSWYGFPEAQQDIAFTALHQFLGHTQGRMPRYASTEDRELFFTLARQLFADATTAPVDDPSPILRFAPGKLRMLDEGFLLR